MEGVELYRDEENEAVPEADIVRSQGVRDPRYVSGGAEVYTLDGRRFFVEGDDVFPITVDIDSSTDETVED